MMSSVTNEADSYVLFELADAVYGVRSRDVQQLEMVAAITAVPNAPSYVRGVVSVRGAVIPVVDLRVRFAFPAIEPGVRSRLLVVRNEGRTVALMVDTAREFARIPAEAIEPPPSSVSGLSGRYLRGIATVSEKIVLVLDIEELLDAQFDIEMESMQTSDRAEESES
jgi:chemotaxis signal transduction protein